MRGYTAKRGKNSHIMVLRIGKCQTPWTKYRITLYKSIALWIGGGILYHWKMLKGNEREGK